MKSLAEAVVESAAFLELSGDDAVDPDSAVQALESIAHTICAASEEEKKALLEYCSAKANALAAATTDQDRRRRDFYREFGVNLGIVDE